MNVFIPLFVSSEKEARQVSAFFAKGVESGYGDNAYKTGDRLVYLNTQLNPGEHYNKTTGEYSCEKSGVYYFTYTVHGWDIKDGPSHSLVSAGLMKQGVVQGKVYFSNYNTERIYITRSQSLVLQCDAGEKVWVESRYNNTQIGGYSNVNVFAGVLLFLN